MKGFDYPDDSPRNVVALRNSLGINRPSESTIQRMFGSRVELAQWSKTNEVLELFNRARTSRSQPAIGSDHIIHFNSIVTRAGILFQEAERRHSSTDNVREDIASLADISVDVLEASLRKKLLPFAVCEKIESAFKILKIKTHGVQTLKDCDDSLSVPPKEVRRCAIELLDRNC